MRFLLQQCVDAVESTADVQDGILPRDPSERQQGGGFPFSSSSQEGGPSAYVCSSWHPSGELFACDDNASVAHWNTNTSADQNQGCSPLGTFCDLQEHRHALQESKVDGKKKTKGDGSHGGAHLLHATSCAWHPRGEVLSVALSQGSYKLVSRTGRLEKTVEGAHEGACISIRWSSDGTALATCGEDGKVKLWSKTGMLRSTIASLDAAVYAVAFGPDSNLLALCCGKHITVKRIGGNVNARAQRQGGNTTGVVMDQDGNGLGGQGGGAGALRSIRWKAHDGVVLDIDWNAANGKIVSGGEDGKYKVWDQYGRLLYQSSPMGLQLDGPGPAGSGAGAGVGAGGSGQVWPVTSIRWRPNGESFAVGTFDLLLLCDESGWIQHKSSPNSFDSDSDSGSTASTSNRMGVAGGEMPCSVLSMTWSSDGTQLACTNGNGSVFTVMILGEVKESGGTLLRLEGPDRLFASHTLPDDTVEEQMDFGGQKILATSVGFHRIVVVTQRQVHAFQPPDLTTAQVMNGLFSPEMPLKLLVQAPSCMLTVDMAGQMQVVTYEGRVMSAPRFQGMRAELMSRRGLALSNDVVAIIDSSDVSQIRLFDTHTGKPLTQKQKQLGVGSAVSEVGGPGPVLQGVVAHPQGAEVAEVGLSLVGSTSERKIAFVDQNRDLYLSLVLDATRAPIKLCMMVDSFSWSSDSSALCAVSDGKLLVWAIPDICFLDQDLLPLCTYEVKTQKLGEYQETGMGELAPRVKAFERGRISTRHGNGALITYMVPLAWYSLTLEKCVQAAKWPKAVHLCRTVARCEGSAKGEQGYLLWACLAALAIAAQHIETAKTAYASLGLIDKVQFMNFLKEVPSDEGRAAELALFKGVPPKEVEAMLLTAGLHYRAIKLNIRMFHWERALELSLKYDLVNVVLWHRRRYLNRQQRPEHLEPFMEEETKLGDFQLIDEDIRAKIQQEKNKEVQRPAGMIRRASISIA